MRFKCVLEVKEDPTGDDFFLRNCQAIVNGIPDHINKSVTPLGRTEEKMVSILTLEGDEINTEQIKESLKDYLTLSMEIPDEATV